MTRPPRGGRAALLAVLATLLLSASACEAPPARAAQVPVARATTWRTLGQWGGTGSRQTESFDVASGAMRLKWDARPATAAPGTTPGRIRVTLHSAISGRPLQVVVDSTSPASGTAHLADDPRTSYLVIEADGVIWTATLDEASLSNVGR